MGVERTYFDLLHGELDFNYRWVQPPQIVFLISTVDEQGEPNLTPATLGSCMVAAPDLEHPDTSYYFAFALGTRDQPGISARQGAHHLARQAECVIAYPNIGLLRQVNMSAYPFPSGISEFDVTGLTPLTSTHVKPPGIAECPVNIEAVVESTSPLGSFYTLFVVRGVAINIDEEAYRTDLASDASLGVLGTQPMFEVAIRPGGHGIPRMEFGTIDPEHLRRAPESLGPLRNWVGSFREWMEDEAIKGRLGREELDHALELERRWDEGLEGEARERTKAALLEIIRSVTVVKGDR